MIDEHSREDDELEGPAGIPVTQGEVIRTLSIEEFRLTYTVHGAERHLAPHAHDRAALTVPLRGGFVEHVEDRPLECSPGTILFKPAGAIHENRYSSEGASCLIVELSSGFLNDLDVGTETARVSANVADGLPWAAALRLHRAVSCSAPSLAIDTAELILEVVGEGLDRVVRPLGEPPRWLIATRDHLAAEWTSPPSLAELARQAGVHPIYLARAFRSHYHCSVGEYVQRRRIDAAVSGLLRTRESLAAMAVRLGFYDQSHFTRHFRRLTGFPPGAFRRFASAASRL